MTDNKQLPKTKVISVLKAERICGFKLDNRYTWLLVDGRVCRDVWIEGRMVLVDAAPKTESGQAEAQPQENGS